MQTSYGMGRLEPVPRFFVFVVLSALTTFFTYSWGGLAVSAAIVFVLFAAGRRYPRAGIISALVAGLLTFLGNLFLSAAGETLFTLGPLVATTGSLERATLLGLRLFFMILLAVAYIAVTPNYELLETARGLRVPKTGEIYLMIVLRYIDVLKYEFTTAMRAMTIRGVKWDGSLLERADGLRKLPVPIIYRLMGHIQSQALAIDSRGGLNIAAKGRQKTQDDIALRMENVSVTYDLSDDPDDDALALHGVDMTLERGEHRLLLGRTGAGKSTLLLLASGLIPHSIGRMAGQTYVFGHDTRKTSMEELSRLARIVFPSAVQGLIGITVEDELNLSLRVHDLSDGEQEALVQEVLAEVGLDESFLPRDTLELSGGEMQRVALASALIARPPLLLLDEVTAQLDPVGRREVQNVLQHVGGETTVLMADPNADVHGADSVSVLAQGRLQQQTTPAEIDIDTLARTGTRVPQLRRLADAFGIPTIGDGVASAAEALHPYATSERSVSPDSPNESPVVVAAKGLTFAYVPGRLALAGVDVEFKRGEFSAILGSNGSGKTTLSLLLSGVLTPTDGRITVASGDGREVRIGYVFQEPSFQMLAGSVEDELAFGPRQFGWPDEHVRDVVDREVARFDLPRGDNPVNLPPAQARQLAIASILAMDPDVIILDEPTNGLDEIETQSLMQALAELHRSGLTIILVTHDVDVACEYAERVLVMSGGAIVLDGPTRTTMSQPGVLEECDVAPPPVAELSLILWPNQEPAVTISEFVDRIGTSARLIGAQRQEKQPM